MDRSRVRIGSWWKSAIRMLRLSISSGELLISSVGVTLECGVICLLREI